MKESSELPEVPLDETGCSGIAWGERFLSDNFIIYNYVLVHGMSENAEWHKDREWL